MHLSQGDGGLHAEAGLKEVLAQIPRYTNKTVNQLTPENWLNNRQTLSARAA